MSSYPCSVKDRERERFVECPKDSGRVAVRTKICQDEGDALKVDIGTRGVTKNIFNDVNSILDNKVETLINTYTVPVGMSFDLSSINCSGDNISKFVTRVNGSLVQTKRTTWNNFNCEFNFLELVLSEGDKVEVFVENRGKGVSDYETTIIGGEYSND